MEGLGEVPVVVPHSLSTFQCVPSFFGGALVVVLLEIGILCYFVIRLLLRKGRHSNSTDSSLAYETQPGTINFSLQGNLWVAPLPEGDVSKAVLQKPGKDSKKQKDKDKDKDKKKDKEGDKEGSNSKRGGESTHDVLEIAPLWRHVVLKGGNLHLTAADGTQEHISLEGCEVLAVSASTSAGGKWAKRYPIKLQHPTRALYHDCKDCLFYTESGYEKEAWCEVLRATTQTTDWCTKLKTEFKEYTDIAETHTPYVTRFHSTREADHFTAAPKKDEDSDENLSKKRIILNKLFRRNNSKGKENTRSANAEEEFGNFSRRLTEQEDTKSISRSGSASSESDPEKTTSTDESVPGAAVVHGLESHRAAGEEIDQGLLCLNMLVGRLFFDFYHSQRRVAWLQNLFQKLISKIKTPNYIQSITIKELDLGRDPPFATALRMLPADAAGALAMEVDFEWHSGAFITIETRVDVRDQIAQEKVAKQMANPGSAGAAAAAIVEDIGNVDLATSKSLKKSNGQGGDDNSIKGRWMNSVKTMMSRVADQVSQVPLMLKIRAVSAKGTCIIRLRAPPSDRIWFSFKEMPEIDLEPEPIIGDRHISSGPVGSFIANQIKVQIRESIVLPLWQDLLLSWMMAEDKDWIPQSALPVGFSAVPNPENERQSSKHNPDVQAKPVKESDKNVGHEKDKNIGQEKAKNLGQENEKNVGHEKPQNHENPQPHSSSMPPQTQSSPEDPPMQPPAASHWQTLSNDVAGSGFSVTDSEPSRPSGRSNSEPSISSRPSGRSSQPSLSSRPSGRSSAPASIREEDESDMREPLVDIDDSKKEKLASSRRGSFDAGASDRVPSDRDLSERVVLERKSQDLSNQLQVSNQQQDASKEDLIKETESSASSRRTKIFSMGKKKLEEGKKKLEEGRRLMQEKMNREKREGGEGSGRREV